MSPPRAVIAEDEANLREQLRETLATVWPELEICAEAQDGVHALRALERHSPDMIFLDIEMPGLNGIEVAKRASGRCHVVFVTAYDSYAVTAFEQGAVDYVMKPLSGARIAHSVERLRELLNSRPPDIVGLLEKIAGRLGDRKPEYLRWVTASDGSETRLVTVDEIIYFRSDNKYTTVATAEKEMLIRVGIKDLADQLDPTAFWQIHRGTIVNLRAVAQVERDWRDQPLIILKNRPEKLVVSRTFASRFKSM
jgi:DNA-binding LytR/AlgR family response regulator